MQKKTKRKKSFLLIEVLVAFAFATITLFFILSLQSTFIKKARFDLKQIECEEKSFEALSLLVENLYESKIPFGLISEEKDFILKLDDKWDALYSFSIIKPKDKEEAANIYKISTEITLLNEGKEISVVKKGIQFTLITQAIVRGKV